MIMEKKREYEGHRADEIVHPAGGDRTMPGSLTRLERAELLRRNAVRAEMERHQRAMDAITIEFGREMRIA
jgi:hypothetical protein